MNLKKKNTSMTDVDAVSLIKNKIFSKFIILFLSFKNKNHIKFNSFLKVNNNYIKKKYIFYCY